MTAISNSDAMQTDQWRSLGICATRDGYGVHEAEDRFWRERLAEAVLRLVGAGLMLMGYVQWFRPVFNFAQDALVAQGFLALGCMGVGAALLLFAARGFRREVRLDVAARRLTLVRLNARNLSCARRHVPLDQIASLCVDRALDEKGLASLRLRRRDRTGAIAVLRGDLSEIEALHRQLCRDIRIAQGQVDTPKTPSQSVKLVRRADTMAVGAPGRDERPAVDDASLAA